MTTGELGHWGRTPSGGDRGPRALRWSPVRGGAVPPGRPGWFSWGVGIRVRRRTCRDEGPEVHRRVAELHGPGTGALRTGGSVGWSALGMGTFVRSPYVSGCPLGLPGPAVGNLAQRAQGSPPGAGPRGWGDPSAKSRIGDWAFRGGTPRAIGSRLGGAIGSRSGPGWGDAPRAIGSRSGSGGLRGATFDGFGSPVGTIGPRAARRSPSPKGRFAAFERGRRA